MALKFECYLSASKALPPREWISCAGDGEVGESCGQVFPDQNICIRSTQNPTCHVRSIPTWSKEAQSSLMSLSDLGTMRSWALLFNGPQNPGSSWVLGSSCLKVGKWKEEWRLAVTYIGSLYSRPMFSSSFRQWLWAQHQGLIALYYCEIMKAGCVLQPAGSQPEHTQCL